MLTPILATKLYIPPPRLTLIQRSRLLDRLNAGLQGKLTLISAPAGFGKTTLVSAWVTQKAEEWMQDKAGEVALPPSRVAWLSLDARDSDPTRFLAYLVAALQPMAPKLGTGVLGLLQSPQPPPMETLLALLLNDIATIQDKFVLVLDDYHVIDDGAPLGAVDAALAYLLDHLPPQMHLVITTREDPQLPLARYRARGQMTELRATDLRFTPAEAADFLNQVMALDLSAAEVAVLEERTEGWIAGLQLAALSLQGRPAGTPDVARFVKAFAGDNRYIVDYLVEEVLQRQPERVRSFLRQTAILDRLSGPLCDAVTGQNDGVALLDALERGNLFVVPLDDQRHWFRYHHLFADVLVAHALQAEPAHVVLLHQRASDWYEQNGLRVDAIRHALAAKDFVRTAGLVELAWPTMDGSFQTATWLGWARAIPDAMVRVRPVLRVAYAWALLNGGELDAAEARLIEVEQWLESFADAQARQQAPSTAHPGGDTQAASAAVPGAVIVDEAQFRTLPASIATARSYLAQSRGDLPVAVKYGQRALDLLPATDHLRRGPAAALLGLAQWASGDLAAAYQTLAAAMAGFQKVGNLHFATSVTSGLADIRTVQGRLHDAIRSYTQSLQLVLAQHEIDTRPLIRGTANLYLGLSELIHEQGNLELATQHLLRAEELGDQAGLPDWRYRLYRTQARFKATAGDFTGALDRLDAAERNFRSTPVPEARPLGALKTQVWVAQGRLRDARRWVQEQGLSVDDEPSFLREFEHMTLARVLIADLAHNPDDHIMPALLRFLARLQQAAEAGGRMGSVIEILILQGLAHQAQGDLAAAIVVLERALRLAEPEGYVCLFVNEGAPMARLLSVAARQGMLPDYSGKLLAAFAPVDVTPPHPVQDRTTPVLPPSAAIQPLIEPLSARELEILQLIAQGLSNDEIGARLFLALSTVKGHNRNIFGKLQVQRRTEAIARARALGLL